MELDSRFYDSVPGDDREYSSAQWSEVFKFLAGNGVMPGEGLEFKVTEVDPVSMNVLVSPGVVFINGRYGRLDSSTQLSVTASAGSIRIDRVILKLDLGTDERKITLEMKTGTPGGLPPALTRAGDVYELSVAGIAVAAGVTSISNADIVNEKNDFAVCGYSLPFGWLVNQRMITAPREDEIIRDGGGNITETKHWFPKKSGGTLRWQEVISRDGGGNITEINRTAYADDGTTVVHTAKETISRDGNGNVTGVVTE